jgi:hypothetical protein
MEENKEINASDKEWSLEQQISSDVIYTSLVENYGEPAVEAVIKKLEIFRNDLSLGDNSKIILRILNGDL